MNTFGLLTGAASLLLTGLGFPLVIRGERTFGYLWWPYLMGMGMLLVAGSLWISSDWLCASCGVLGAVLVWGSTELKEQAVRAELGWFPYSPYKINPPFASTIAKWKAPHL